MISIFRSKFEKAQSTYNSKKGASNFDAAVAKAGMVYSKNKLNAAERAIQQRLKG